jgi:hypothetical protein
MRQNDKATAARRYVPDRNRRIDSGIRLNVEEAAPSTAYLSSTDSGRFSMIGELESSVSMIQTAVVGLEKIRHWLSEMKRFLEEEGYRSFQAQIPISVINNFLTDRLAHVRVTAETASFKGRALLNGKSGVRGEAIGDHLSFIKGSARSRSSGAAGYPVAIYQSPRPSILIGSDRLSPETIGRESIIALADNDREVRYRLRGDEDPETLVDQLQQYLFDNGFDINVYRTPDQHLLFRHNQLGSSYRFQGMSANTRLLSDIPGHFREAEPGLDVSGTIGSEPAVGEGGFLTGERGNLNTDGLVVYYDGWTEQPGQVVGYVRVEQNGIKVPVDPSGYRVEILSIPSVRPELLALRVPNRSGFGHLGDIRADTVTKCRDALLLLGWSIDYLDYLKSELRWNEANFVERAVDLLRSTMSPQPAGTEIVHFSSQKAKDMADELKSMLGHTIPGSISSWR